MLHLNFLRLKPETFGYKTATDTQKGMLFYDIINMANHHLSLKGV